MNYGDAENITKILTLKNVKENEYRNIFRNREHAALAAYFMTEKSWTFCPYTTAIRLQKNGACIYELKNSPPEQVVYYLVNENRKTATIHKFLELLTEKLKTLPKDKITSFLS